MNRASKVLAQAPLDVPTTWAALSDESGVPLSTLFYRAHGRPSREDKARLQLYLTVEEEKALFAFLLLMASLGQPVRMKYVPALAYRIARQRGTTKRPDNPPNKNWARAFERRHPLLKARRARAMDWKRHENNIYPKMTEWFEVIGRVLQNPAVKPKNVYNMDETGVMLSKLGTVKVLAGKDALRDYRGAGTKRTMVTAIECISADGRSLLPLIVWPASTHRSNWTTHPTPGWHYGHSENGYNDSKINLEWLTRVFDPQTKEIANGEPRVLICDGFGTHETLEVLEFCLGNNIIMCRLPSHTSHKLQPCDVSVFGPLKIAYRDQVERLNRGGIDAIGKEHFTYLYSPARQKAITKRNIIAGWAATGLFPFNPDRVLRNTPKPPAALRPAELNEIVAPVVQDEVLQSPVTPVTAAGVMSLQKLIEQDAGASDELSKQRLQRRVQKLASAAQIFFAKQCLLQDHNRLLAQINNEAKVRRSTRSEILGRAKVMSYQELEEARAKRAAKDKAAAAKVKTKVKAKGGRKRKDATPGADVSANAPEVEVGSSTRKRRLPRQSKALEQGPWTIPVAQMY